MCVLVKSPITTDSSWAFYSFLTSDEKKYYNGGKNWLTNFSEFFNTVSKMSL